MRGRARTNPVRNPSEEGAQDVALQFENGENEETLGPT
jgi:hypothetical protein